MIGIRPNTLKKLRRENVKVSSLHVSIAKMSYLKEHQHIQHVSQVKFYKIIKPEDRQKNDNTKK